MHIPVARDNVRVHTHAGVEFIYTIKGRLNVHIDGQEHALESGDSMYFDSALPHGYRRAALNMLRHRGYDSLIAFLDEPPHELSLRKLV